MILRLCNKIIYIWLTYYYSIEIWKQYHSNSTLSIHMNMKYEKKLSEEHKTWLQNGHNYL